MAEGILAEVEDGFARIQFLDSALAGPALTKLLELVGPGVIDVDTRSGSRKIYIVPEGTAREAGLLDGEALPEPEPAAPAEPAPVEQLYPEGEPSDAWTVAQMKEYAEAKGISLAGADKKADILALITA